MSDSFRSESSSPGRAIFYSWRAIFREYIMQGRKTARRSKDRIEHRSHHYHLPEILMFILPTPSSGSPKHTRAVSIPFLLGSWRARGGRGGEEKRKRLCCIISVFFLVLSAILKRKTEKPKRACLKPKKSVASGENCTFLLKERRFFALNRSIRPFA